MHVSTDQHILRLQISIHKTMGMQILNGYDYFTKIVLCIFLLYLAQVMKNLVKISKFAIFKPYEDSFWSLESTFSFNDERVIK